MVEINKENYSSLKAGDLIVEIDKRKVSYWEYLMIRPHNENYVLMIESLSKDAKKVYIPTLVGGGYFINYTTQEIYQKQIEVLEDEITSFKRRLCKEDSKQEKFPTYHKFRVGDEIKTQKEEPLIITKIDDKGYWSKDLFICGFDEECIWDLVEQKPLKNAKEAWKEMRFEVYVQASANRHEPNISDDNSKIFSLNDIDEIFERISDCIVEQKPVEIMPIFRIGDVIRKKGKDYTFNVDRIQGGYYHCDRNHGAFFPIEEQGNWELVEQKPVCSDDKKLTDVNHEYFSELLENDNSDNIDDYAYQVAYCMSHDWVEETATWDDVQKACKLGAEWKEKHWKNSSTA